MRKSRHKKDSDMVQWHLPLCLINYILHGRRREINTCKLPSDFPWHTTIHTYTYTYTQRETEREQIRGKKEKWMGRDKGSRKIDYTIQVHILLDAKMEDVAGRCKI